MDTTITAVLLLGYIGNVGDSRPYHCTNGVLKQITQDVAHMVAEGLISAEERYCHPARNRITRALGISSSMLADSFRFPFSRNETLLLCSNGLWEMIRDHGIEQTLVELNATHIVEQIIDKANSNGGSDNISCTVVRLT
jgi:PPM family protein phosphatase